MPYPSLSSITTHQETRRPSSSDFDISKKLREAGKLLDIEVLDHIVLGDEEFHSIADTLEWKSWKDTESKIA